MSNVFKWYHYEKEIIILAVRWYCKYSLSYRNLVEILSERGLNVYASTIYRWVVKFTPMIAENAKTYLRKTNNSWRMDETYLKIKGNNVYLYRAIDSSGNTIDFLVSEKRDKITAKKFLIKALKNSNIGSPKIITTDKYKPTISAIEELKNEHLFDKNLWNRKSKYKNNLIEQDHRRIKRITKPMLGFKSLHSCEAIISGIETFTMIRKNQIPQVNNVLQEINFIYQLLGVTPSNFLMYSAF